MDTLTKAQIWATLSEIDVTPYCTESEVYGDLVIKYVPWMRAHEIMMAHYPEYTWDFTEDPQGRECHYFDDGSAEVRCRMTIGEHTNITYLPIHRGGKPITSPSATDINTAKQRCRVKAMAEFGLGYQMWLGELVKAEPVAEPATPPEDDEPNEAELVTALWKKTKIEDSKTFSDAQKLHRRYLKGLQNRGWTDNSGRWEALIEKHGWGESK